MQFIKITLNILRKLRSYLLSFLPVIGDVFLEVADLVGELVVNVSGTLLGFLLGLLDYIAELEEFVVELTVTVVRIILQFLG